jgi:hypothetical protein
MFGAFLAPLFFGAHQLLLTRHRCAHIAKIATGYFTFHLQEMYDTQS